MILGERGALRAIVLGAGYRGRAYAAFAKEHPDQLEIAYLFMDI